MEQNTQSYTCATLTTFINLYTCFDVESVAHYIVNIVTIPCGSSYIFADNSRTIRRKVMKFLSHLDLIETDLR